jgi:hypothetical protein
MREAKTLTRRLDMIKAELGDAELGNGERKAAGRPKEFFDDFACLEIAMHAGGYADPLVWKPGRDMEGFEKVPVCTVAGWLADSGNVKGNSRPAIIESYENSLKSASKTTFIGQDYLRVSFV